MDEFTRVIEDLDLTLATSLSLLSNKENWTERYNLEEEEVKKTSARKNFGRRLRLFLPCKTTVNTISNFKKRVEDCG